MNFTPRRTSEPGARQGKGKVDEASDRPRDLSVAVRREIAPAGLMRDAGRRGEARCGAAVGGGRAGPASGGAAEEPERAGPRVRAGAQPVRDIPTAGHAQQTDREVAETGHHVRAGGRAHLRAVFVEGDVADPVDAVLDTPMAAVEGEQPGGIGARRRETGEAEDDLVMRGRPVERGHGPLDPKDLRDAGKGQIADQVAAGPDRAGLDPPVPFRDVSVLRGGKPPGGGYRCPL